MMLDTQYYNVNDPRPYDDTGWTLGALRNVKTVRVTDKSILSAPMQLIRNDVHVRGRMTSDAATRGNALDPVYATAYLINHNTENTLATLRFRLRDVKMRAAEEPFKVQAGAMSSAGDVSFNAGSFIIPREGNPADLRPRLEAAISELGLTAMAVGRMPEVKAHEIGVPRIAILHTWTNTQNDGWFRIEFDRLKIPYSYISDQVVR